MPIEVSQTDGSAPPRTGIFLLYGLVIFLFLLFVIRFWYLQMLRGEYYAQQAHANRTRQAQVYATRGIIIDPQGRLLAENRPAFCIAVVREDCPDIPATLAQVSQWTDVSLSFLQAKFQADAKQVRSFDTQLLVTDIPFEKVANIEEQLYKWPGLSIVTRQRRFYPHSSLFAHILGYVAEANDAELKADEELALGDITGKQGLELVLEKQIRGAKGQNAVEVDVLGRQLKRVQEKASTAGANITLSLDIDLQKAASEALGKDTGCVVVMEPESGKLRALVTQPSFDNNLFTAKLSPRDWATLVEDPNHPLQNRAIQSIYPPGSVWKLMMAGLFLEQKVNPKATVHCSGSVTLGTHTFRCWKSGGHGSVDMLHSLIASCDVYYYEMAQRVGIDNIERFAKACGFGRPTGIDLPHERSGLVPGKNWKMNRFRQPWQRGDTLNTSIGQGFTLVTPVQMAVFVSALLNGGQLLKPSLVESEPKIVVANLPMPAAHRDFILEGMRLTASSGTAKRVARPDAIMGGKTGTAQVRTLGEKRQKNHEMAYRFRDHAWFTSWGKKGGKTYVVVAMVEHGGGGSSAAGPVCAKVFEALFGPVRGKGASAQNEAPQPTRPARQTRDTAPVRATTLWNSPSLPHLREQGVTLAASLTQSAPHRAKNNEDKPVGLASTGLSLLLPDLALAADNRRLRKVY